MEAASQIKMLSQLKQQRKVLAIIAVVSGLCTLLLTVNTLLEKRTVVVIPAHVAKEFEISNKGVSEEYLELMSRDFIQSFLNITPESREYINGYLLRMAHPDYHGELKQQLAELFEEIVTKQITLHFNLSEMAIDRERLTAQANGYLVKHMGERKIESKLRQYHIAFANNGTRLLLKEFYEVEDEKKASN